MLNVGSRGSFVRAWQAFLVVAEMPCDVDGVFGIGTHDATLRWQTKVGLAPDGRVGSGSFRAAIASGLWPAPEGWPLIQCQHFTQAERAASDVDWVVLHTMEVPEAQGMAIEIAGRFALETSPRASAHFHVDDVDVIQGCSLGLVAWHAEGGNRRGIGIEHAGTASQRPAQWDDDYSRAQLELSAKLAAELCSRYSIPAVWLSADALKRGERGITDHAAINDAFNGGGGHRDVGAWFPRAHYIELVAAVAA